MFAKDLAHEHTTRKLSLPMSDAPPSKFRILVEAGIAALYLGALVSIAGWTFADRYFAELGLGISAIEGLETSNFSAYALWVFRDGWLSILFLAAGLLASGVLFRHFLGPIGEGPLAGFVAIAAVLSLFGAGHLGAERASQSAAALFTEKYKTLVRVNVIAKKDSPLESYLAARPAFSENGCLRKVFMDRKHLYAYPGVNDAPRQPILIIPLSEIALIETSIANELCTF